MTNQSWQVGDIFTLPVDDDRVGVGQIAAIYKEGEYYFAIFDSIFSSVPGPDIDEALNSPLLFLALSLDAKLYHKHWIVIGNRPVPEGLPMPAYKELRGTHGEFDVVDYSGKRRRPGVNAEGELLTYRTTVAPVVLEDALRARHGLDPWDDAYDDLRPNEKAATTDLFGE